MRERIGSNSVLTSLLLGTLVFLARRFRRRRGLELLREQDDSLHHCLQSRLGRPSELDKFLVAPENTADPIVKVLRQAFQKSLADPEVQKDGDKFFGEGWKAYPGERIETVIRDHSSIPKEAKDFITKMRKKYNLPLGETKG